MLRARFHVRVRVFSDARRLLGHDALRARNNDERVLLHVEPGQRFHRGDESDARHRKDHDPDVRHLPLLPDDTQRELRDRRRNAYARNTLWRKTSRKDARIPADTADYINCRNRRRALRGGADARSRRSGEIHRYL